MRSPDRQVYGQVTTSTWLHLHQLRCNPRLSRHQVSTRGIETSLWGYEGGLRGGNTHRLGDLLPPPDGHRAAPPQVRAPLDSARLAVPGDPGGCPGGRVAAPEQLLALHLVPGAALAFRERDASSAQTSTRVPSVRTRSLARRVHEYSGSDNDTPQTAHAYVGGDLTVKCGRP
eukprot:6952361-Pyramimonas_sp.AAC.1